MEELTPERITIIALLMAIIGAGIREWWVFGWVYKGMITWYEKRIEGIRSDYEARLKDRDEQLLDAEKRIARWENVALRALNVAEKTTPKAEE